MFKRLMQAQRDHMARARRAEQERTEARRAGQLEPRKPSRLGAALGRAMAAETNGCFVHIDGSDLVWANNMVAGVPIREPLSGVTAHVATAGSVRTRPTVSRFVALGALPGVPALAALAWQKKVDEREVHLIVDGPAFQWAVAVKPGRAAGARQLAAQITTAARRLDSRT